MSGGAAAEPTRRGNARDLVLLASAMASLYVMVQVYAGTGPTTLVTVTGVRPLAGLAPAVIFTMSAMAAFVAGRAMDRWGRVPVIAGGFALGACGAAITGGGLRLDSAVVVGLGLVVVGGANGVAFMCRVAAADLYPPERRARAMASVMMGAVVGALLGPLVLMPLVGRGMSHSALGTAWFVASGAMIVGAFLVTRVRTVSVPTMPIAAPPAAKQVRVLIRRPGALPALLGAASSLGIMVAIMSLVGHGMTGQGHHAEAVFPVLSAHFIGMFAFMIPIGIAVDRVGHARSMLVGLAVLGASLCSLAVFDTTGAISLALFGVGFGWNITFVAATSRLAVLTEATERGTMFGLNDLMSGLSAAVLSLAGGAVLPTLGLGGLGLALAALVAVSALVIATATRQSSSHASPP